MSEQFICMRLIVGLLVLSLGYGEPVPSQFSYESQLLEKIIRMELKMEQMEARINQTQVNVHTALHNVSTTLDNKTAELRLLQDRDGIPVVAFHAYGPEDTSIDTHQKLILKTEALNIGGGYDRFLGIFTSPVTGLYLFTANMCNYAGVGFYYYIMLDGNVIAKSTKYNNVQHDCGSCSVITQVTKGQRLWIQSASGSASSNQLLEDTYRQSSLSGVLLHK